MTPEEASELGELLWMCCRKSAYPVHPLRSNSCCPLWAAFGAGCGDKELGERVTDSFILAFDDRAVFGELTADPDRIGDDYGPPDQEAFALGRMFREHALSGEPW